MAPSGMVKERGRGGVVQKFQIGGSDPAKQVISERVREMSLSHDG